jgi:hypothetical protein
MRKGRGGGLVREQGARQRCSAAAEVLSAMGGAAAVVLCGRGHDSGGPLRLGAWRRRYSAAGGAAAVLVWNSEDGAGDSPAWGHGGSPVEKGRQPRRVAGVQRRWAQSTSANNSLFLPCHLDRWARDVGNRINWCLGSHLRELKKSLIKW